MTLSAEPYSQTNDLRFPGTSSREVPHDFRAEKGTIGSMIIDPAVIGTVSHFVSHSDFLDERNAVFARVIFEAWDKNHAMDASLLWSEVERRGLTEAAGGIEYLSELANSVPTSAHAEFYAAHVKETSRLRGLLTAANEITTDALTPGMTAEDAENRALSRLYRVANVAGVKANMGDAIHEMMERLDKATKGIFGLPTGLTGLDDLLGGMEPGEMVVVGARPSVGKTGFLTGVVDFLASVAEKKCLLFSAEMPRDQIARRFVAARADVDLQKIRRGMLTKEEVARLGTAVSELAALSDKIIIVDTPNIPLSRLRSIAFEHACESGLDFVGIDYAQLIVPPDMGKNSNRTQQVGAISRGVKGMARELKVPVMLLAQLNRGAEGEGRMPRMSDLRESGDLEQDADGVILLHREAVARRGEADWEQNNPDKVYEADIIVAKQRNGQAGAVKVAFHGPAAAYMDLDAYRNRYIYGVSQ